MATRTQSTQPRIVRLSDALQDRLDTYCAGHDGRTATSVAFEAIDHFRGELGELVHNAQARPASPWARPDVHYLGSGRVQVRIRADDAQQAVLEQLSAELDLPVTTWLPPVLNAYLPGHREPENMPWLLQVGQEAEV